MQFHFLGRLELAQTAPGKARREGSTLFPVADMLDIETVAEKWIAG